MKPLEEVDRVETPDGVDLVLWQRDEFFEIRLDGLQLMSSDAHTSEEALAEMASEALREASRTRPRRARTAPQVLLGGLGMGFTLRATLDRFGPESRILVAEIFPQVVEWNRGPLAHLASRPLDDPRVTVFQGDVRHALALERSRFDAILLDVDNGPNAFTLSKNDQIYSYVGVEKLAAALKPDGVLGVWASEPEPEFEKRLESVGLRVRHRQVPPRLAPASQDTRDRVLHSLYLATRKRTGSSVTAH